MCSKKTLSSIFINYIHQVIRKSALAYYRKKFLYQNRVIYFEQPECFSQYMDNPFFLDYLEPNKIDEIEIYAKNDSLAFALSKLSLKEKSFIYDKYVLCKTDKEISYTLNISRQGVSIFKKRILNKIQFFFNSY